MLNHFALLDFGGSELIVIGVILLLLFGGKKLPDISENAGKSLKHFKDASSGAQELHDEIKNQVTEVTQGFLKDLNQSTTQAKPDEKPPVPPEA